MLNAFTYRIQSVEDGWRSQLQLGIDSDSLIFDAAYFKNDTVAKKVSGKLQLASILSLYAKIDALLLKNATQVSMQLSSARDSRVEMSIYMLIQAPTDARDSFKIRIEDQRAGGGFVLIKTQADSIHGLRYVLERLCQKYVLF